MDKVEKFHIDLAAAVSKKSRLRIVVEIVKSIKVPDFGKDEIGDPGCKT